jgi:hypothetical protein
MAKKEDFGFSFDERTNVPTFEEVSYVMPKFLRDKKRHNLFIFASIFIIVLVTTVGFITFKTVGINKISSPIKGMTGFVTNDVNYSDKEIYEINVEGIKINLPNEEKSLIENLTSNLTKKCSDEKAKVKVETKLERESQCQKEINTLKDKYEDEISGLEDQIDKLQEKYDNCKDDLNSCGE